MASATMRRRAVLLCSSHWCSARAIGRGAACWTPPVDAPIVDPYRAPACTYCPGHRGIEFGPRPGQTVRAVAGGLVSFAGTVAGTRYVVVDHGDGLRATYGRLAAVQVRRGSSVAAGDPIGTTTGTLLLRPAPRRRTRRRPGRSHAHAGRSHGTRHVSSRLDGTPAPSPGPGPAGLSQRWPGPVASVDGPPPGGPVRLRSGRNSDRAAHSAVARRSGHRDSASGARAGAQPTAAREHIMAVVTMRQMLEAGVHFGHQTRRWNPKMKRFIFGERNGIYIIDLEQTLTRVETAYNFVRDLSAKGGVGAVHRHQEAGAGPRARLRRPGRHAVRERALARRHAHQLRDHLEARRQDAGVRAHARARASSTRCPRRKHCCSAASSRSCRRTSVASAA